MLGPVPSGLLCSQLVVAGADADRIATAMSAALGLALLTIGLRELARSRYDR